MIPSTTLFEGNDVVALSATLRASSLSRFEESRDGRTERLFASMLRDRTTRPVHGRLTASAYFAWYSIRGLATARLISSVALRWS